MRKIPYFDGHCDTISRCERLGCGLRENDGHLDLKRLLTFEKAAQFFAIYHDLAAAPADGMFAECQRQQALFASEIEKNSDIAAQCRTGEEVAAANAAGKMAAILSVEGSELLGCDPGNLEAAEKWGVRSVNLTWNWNNDVSGSHLRQPERGLSDVGKAFVREAQRRNILMDVSHLSDPGFWDLVKMTTKPIIATHSNSRAVCSHTRNLTDDMFRAVMETGGAVGLNYWVKFVAPVEQPTMEDIIRHVDHFMELGGQKTLCLGADLDGCAYLAGGMTGLQDMPMLWKALSDHGYDDALLEDIFYNNLLRVFSM